MCASCRKRFRGEFVELSVADSGPGIAPHGARAHVRAVLHHQGGRARQRHGARHGARHRARARRPRPGREHARRRQPLPHPAADLTPATQPRPRAAAARARPAQGRAAAGACWWSTTRRRWPTSCASCSRAGACEATAMTSPLGVLERIARERYDLVILDQTMPGITGIEPRARDRRRAPRAAGGPLHRQQRPSRPGGAQRRRRARAAAEAGRARRAVRAAERTPSLKPRFSGNRIRGPWRSSISSS